MVCSRETFQESRSQVHYKLLRLYTVFFFGKRIGLLVHAYREDRKTINIYITAYQHGSLY